MFSVFLDFIYLFNLFIFYPQLSYITKIIIN